MRPFQIISQGDIPWSVDSKRRWKTLLEEPETSLRILLEHCREGQAFSRQLPQGWEEIFLVDGGFLDKKAERAATCFVLPPHLESLSLQAGTGGCLYLCASYDQRLWIQPSTPLNDDRGLDENQGTNVGKNFSSPNHGQAAGKAFVAPLHHDDLIWSEIPARRRDDPGGRVAELSRNATGSLVTSLMECRPGWILDEHQHPSDVMTYCIRGEGILGVEGEEYSYSEGQLVVIPAGTVHRFQTSAGGAFLIVFVFETVEATSRRLQSGRG